MKNYFLYGKTHTGKRRKDNQDTFHCSRLWTDDKALLVVVDGVGGYAGGDKAASIARAGIEEYMRKPKGDILTMLREAVIYANNRIAEERKSDPSLSEMCCVLTAVVADTYSGQFHYVHVGDTRLYLLNNGKLQKITRDHSFVGIHEDAGELTEEEAMVHPQRNQILREVGSTPHRMDDQDFMDFGTLSFGKHDVLLLCSDGLTDLVNSETIRNILNEKTTLPIKAGKLIDKANELGGYDNITVVLLDNQQDPQPAPPESSNEEKWQAQGTETKPKNLRKRSISRLLLRSLLLAVFIAGTGWYYYAQYRTEPEPMPISEISFVKNSKPHDSAGNSAVFISRSANPATPGPLNQMPEDTLRINQTQKLSVIQQYMDSSGHRLALMPLGKNNFPAIRLDVNADTIRLSNIKFMNFEKAILIDSAGAILLDNVTFENIRYPMFWASGTRTNNATILILNPVKN